MPRLPNEILDGIWLERCNLGFEPRILQEKWINVGHMRLPAFYVAQPQAFMTQLCHGAREVAAKGFYSRVFDNPSTGDGGFWWNKDDVLYIDMEFYRELHPSRKALILGRDKITRVALEIQIDEDSTTIVQLILDWFPNVSRVFSTGSARLFSSRDVWAASDGPQSEPSESAITKSVPIKGFYGDYCPKIAIPGDLFVRVQGLTGLLNKPVPAEHRARLFEEIHHYHYDIRLYVFNRSETHGKLDPNGSPCEDRSGCFPQECLYTIIANQRE